MIHKLGNTFGKLKIFPIAILSLKWITERGRYAVQTHEPHFWHSAMVIKNFSTWWVPGTVFVGFFQGAEKTMVKHVLEKIGGKNILADRMFPWRKKIVHCHFFPPFFPMFFFYAQLEKPTNTMNTVCGFTWCMNFLSTHYFDNWFSECMIDSNRCYIIYIRHVKFGKCKNYVKSSKNYNTFTKYIMLEERPIWL